MTDNAGALLLRSIHKQLQLTREVVAVLPDHRDSRKFQHKTEQLLRQRVYALICG
ncbi:transposase [Teredinibacter turnerae]|uniref:transposase n=1 Tax=Teredinibacter turnerae TaxID=2426 RepID=UPI0009B7BEC4